MYVYGDGKAGYRRVSIEEACIHVPVYSRANRGFLFALCVRKMLD